MSTSTAFSASRRSPASRALVVSNHAARAAAATTHRLLQRACAVIAATLLTFLSACSGGGGGATLAPDSVLTISALPLLVFEGPQGGPFDGQGAATVTNSSPDEVVWTATSDRPWLRVFPTQAVLAAGESAVLTIDVAPLPAADLTPGVHVARVTITEQGVGVAGFVSVSLTVATGGWTTFTESIDTRKVYVSSSLGNDANNGLASTTPKRTLSAAKALMRNGFPDWLLLRAGDTWTEALGTWTASGRSAAEPMLITSFGDGARPYLRTGSSDGITAFAAGGGSPTRDHVAIVGLHFRAHTYSGVGEPAGVAWVIESTGLTIEGCLFENYQINVSVPGFGGRKRDVAIRRNVIVDAFATSGTVGHGIYLANCDGVLIEENVLDHNGWNENLPLAVPTIFRHSIYVQGGSGACTGVVVRGNVIANSASHGVQMRSGGVVEDNLFLRNPIAILLGGGNEPNPGGVQVACRRNVILDARDIDLANPRGWAIEAKNLASGVISGNLIANREDGDFPLAIDLNAASNGIGIFDTHVIDNVVHDWGGPLQLQGGTSLFGDLEIARNDLQQASGSSPLLRHFQPNTVADVESSENRFFHATLPQSSWILVGGTGHTVASWASLVGDVDSSATAVGYPDPMRTIATYHASLGGGASLASFLTQARLQSKELWRPAYTASVANAYFRAGFDME